MKAEKIKASLLKEKMLEITNDMYDGSIDCTMAVADITLPDGRIAQVQVKVTTEDHEFIEIV